MTGQFTMPADVMANVRRRWPDVADSWSARVHDEFRTLCEQYDATPRGLLSARYGFVAAVDTADGPLVLRSSPDPHGPHQAAVATALASLNAAPHVHQTINTDHGTWTVLQRVVPGTPLSEADPTTVNPVALFRPLAAMR